MEREQLKVGDVILIDKEKHVVFATDPVRVYSMKKLLSFPLIHRIRWKPYEISHGLWEKEIIFLKRLQAFFEISKSFEIDGRVYKFASVDKEDNNNPVKLTRLFPSIELSWYESKKILWDYFFGNIKNPVQKCKHHNNGFCARYQSQVECDIELPPCEYFEEVQ